MLNSTEASALSMVTADDWNNQQTISATSWFRMRSFTAEFLEKALKYKLRPATSENITKLRNASKCHWDAWETLPTQLRYYSNCWLIDSDPQVSFMKASIYITYLHCDYLICKMIEQHDELGRQRALTVSAQILSLIQEIGSFRRRNPVFHMRFAYLLVWDGLSPAITLSKAVQKMAREEKEDVILPPDVDRARIIRLLSVFVSDLEGISEPGEPTYEVCERARASISGALDELLSGPQLEVHATIAPKTTAPQNIGAAMLGGPDRVNTATMDGWDWFGDADWANMMDWTNMYAEL
ncbi:hypothetical protein VHEMI08910 [[Torrubiella] hemipterigena]|uniref:Uncharacterized protein n=1 Tax=[Torrubiella] hemipterigena TaxID=1531966 RepID=A0A0A1T897_9HYPO|nr:hypothetical protein VHEMI08910 [[Torrubiella] hemipterigena]